MENCWLYWDVEERITFRIVFKKLTKVNQVIRRFFPFNKLKAGSKPAEQFSLSRQWLKLVLIKYEKTLSLKQAHEIILT